MEFMYSQSVPQKTPNWCIGLFKCLSTTTTASQWHRIGFAFPEVTWTVITYSSHVGGKGLAFTFKYRLTVKECVYVEEEGR